LYSIEKKKHASENNKSSVRFLAHLFTTTKVEFVKNSLKKKPEQNYCALLKESKIAKIKHASANNKSSVREKNTFVD
jgi:hypothetical protein